MLADKVMNEDIHPPICQLEPLEHGTWSSMYRETSNNGNVNVQCLQQCTMGNLLTEATG